jgi:UDPglucose 6-dehydrogenase
MAKMGVAVIGSEGWVGKSMMELYPDAYKYDEPQRIGERALVNACEVAFICVPTPNEEGFELDTSIVEDVVNWCESDVIVIRSTVNPGTADKLKANTGKRIVSQPEYLGETPNHPMLDPNTRPFMILGGDPEDRRKVIETYTQTYNANISIRQVSNLEAEVIKLSENRAIMYKVMQCQELYDACEAAGVDYYTVRDAVYGDDPRFNLWWTFIYPNARGANSKCIPKDVYAWSAWAESSQLTDAMLRYNERLLGENS